MIKFSLEVFCIRKLRRLIEQVLVEGAGVLQCGYLGESILGRRAAQCKGPEAHRVYLRNSEEAWVVSVKREKWSNGG